jgi:hypothetical protein
MGLGGPQRSPSLSQSRTTSKPTRRRHVDPFAVEALRPPFGAVVAETRSAEVKWSVQELKPKKPVPNPRSLQGEGLVPFA